MKHLEKEFLGGTLLAVVFFLIWGVTGGYSLLTWQELVVSLIYGGYILLAHFLMSKGKVLKVIGVLLIVASVIMGTLWLTFVFLLTRHPLVF